MRALKEWAVDRMTMGTQTPWAWFQFMKLLEVLDTFIESGEAAGTGEKLRRVPKETPGPSNVVPLEAAMRQRALD